MKRATIPGRRATLTGVVALFFLLIFGATLGGCESEGPTFRSQQSAESGSAAARALAPRGALQRAQLREEDGIVDGDTLRAIGFDQTIRLLCLDTEETLDGEALQAARRDWAAYQQEMSAQRDGPANYGTFLGNEATEFARDFFADYDEIFVEYQSPRHTRGFFGRHLAYVWVHDEEQGWKNFNVEAVRAGMSPYFTSYGWCDRYHDHFVAAQTEARAAGRGIWAPGAKAYDDYDERLQAWERRARQVGTFRAHFAERSGVVELGTDTAMARLRLYDGQRVVVFGALNRHVPRGQPPRIDLYHRHREDFAVVVDDGLDFAYFRVPLEAGDFLYVEGTVEMYRGNPRLRLDTRSFIRTGDSPPPMRSR